MDIRKTEATSVALECAEVIAYGTYDELVEFSRTTIPSDSEAMKEAARLSNYGVSLFYAFRKGRIFPKAETLERMMLGLMPGCVLAIVRLPEDVEYQRPMPRPVDDGTVATGVGSVGSVGSVGAVAVWRKIPGHDFEAGYNAVGQLVPGKVRPIAFQSRQRAAAE